MQAVLAFVLMIVGVGLIITGVSASESLQSSITKLFTGLPTERSQWLIIGGFITALIGMGVYLRRPIA